MGKGRGGGRGEGADHSPTGSALLLTPRCVSWYTVSLVCSPQDAPHSGRPAATTQEGRNNS